MYLFRPLRRQLLNVPLIAGLSIVVIAWLAWYSTRGLSNVGWGHERLITGQPAVVITVDRPPASSPQVDTSTANNDGGKQDE